MAERVDILVVGGGISGVSLAARLAGRRRVAVLEAEDHLGMHATGRSAALLVEAYGPPEIRTLTARSRAFFESPPEGFSDAPLSRRRGGLVYAGHDQLDRLRAEFELASRTAEVAWLEADEVQALAPLLRAGVAAAGFVEPNALDLDASALLSGFTRLARRDGASIVTGARVERIASDRDGWQVETGGRTFSTAIVANAAGAWADALAGLAGVRPRSLQPMRRTAATIAVNGALAEKLVGHPFVSPVDESYYFKPEAGAVMVSLSDETPSAPGDAFPDDLDVAMALDRFHSATIVPESRPAATWAGLRTFAPDRRPVIGFDSEAPGFFWYAGQGGYGIQTSPVASALAAKLILGERLEPDDAALAAALNCGRMGIVSPR